MIKTKCLGMSVVFLAAIAAKANYPDTSTNDRIVDVTKTGRITYHVLAVVVPHGLPRNSIRVEFATTGRWGVPARFVRVTSTGNFVYAADVNGHPGNTLQSRDWVGGRIDDYSQVVDLP